MANVLVEENNIKEIANAIREKNQLTTQYLPSEMPQAIRDIPSGGSLIEEECTYEITHSFKSGEMNFTIYLPNNLTFQDLLYLKSTGVYTFENRTTNLYSFQFVTMILDGKKSLLLVETGKNPGFEEYNIDKNATSFSGVHTSNWNGPCSPTEETLKIIAVHL